MDYRGGRSARRTGSSQQTNTDASCPKVRGLTARWPLPVRTDLWIVPVFASFPLQWISSRRIQTLWLPGFQGVTCKQLPGAIWKLFARRIRVGKKRVFACRKTVLSGQIGTTLPTQSRKTKPLPLLLSLRNALGIRLDASFW
jgi:hypothetical protein